MQREKRHGVEVGIPSIVIGDLALSMRDKRLIAVCRPPTTFTVCFLALTTACEKPLVTPPNVL